MAVLVYKGGKLFARAVAHETDGECDQRAGADGAAAPAAATASTAGGGGDGSDEAAVAAAAVVASAAGGGAVRVRYLDGSHYAVRRENVRLLLDHTYTPLLFAPTEAAPAAPAPRVMFVCAETDTYRAVARCEARPGMRALEIGSDLGYATQLLASRCGAAHTLGVDLAPDRVARARTLWPDVRFECLDVLQRSAPAALRAMVAELGAPAGGGGGADVDGAAIAADRTGIDAIARAEAARAPACDGGGEAAAAADEAPWLACVDINGNRALPAVMAVVRMVAEELRPAVMVVKSRALFRLLSTGES